MKNKQNISVGIVILFYMISFSVGDELGFAESLGNVEGNKRRSISQRDGLNTIGVLPASKLPPVKTQRSVPIVQQSRPQAITTMLQPISSSPITSLDNNMNFKRIVQPKMTEAISLPLGVPAFKPIPKVQDRMDQQQQQNFNRKGMYQQYPTINMQQQNLTFIQQPNKNSYGVPMFQAMPSSITQIQSGQQVNQIMANKRIDQINNNNNNKMYQTNQMINMNSSPPQLSSSQSNKLPQIDLKGHSIEELAAVANVSVKVIQAAIQMKQQQLYAEQQAKDAIFIKQMMETPQYITPMAKPTTTTTTSTTTTTTTTTTPRPTTPKYSLAGGNKVMNAPKEYYPVGYDKNFDDNFVTRVDLPPTTFHCGDQKHFPGLYADIDLGCMVFHVCALTDDGLIMKSFLCPESTLFDQTVLKCNWWFYVECKTSKNLYDSNLPVSKSYQLMKALTFFSKYKNNQNDHQRGVDGVDVEALRNSVVTNNSNN